MELAIYYKYFIGNFIYFTLSFLFLFLNQSYSAINISSPLMLTLSNLCLFIMNSFLISYELVDKYNVIEDYKISFCQIIPFLFIIGYILVFISLILRINRIIKCLNLNKILSIDVKNKTNIFYSQKYILDEKFYCKIITIIIMFVMLFVGLLFYYKGGFIPVPFYFIKYFINNLNENITLEFIKLINFCWMIFYIIQGLISLFYIFNLLNANLIKSIKFELIIQIILYMSTLILGKYYYNNQTESNLNNVSLSFIIISILFVFFDTYLPIFRAFSDKIKITYSFNQKLATNLYLFLSDEICYYSFSNYLKDSLIDSFFICLYTKIMKYKYKYSLEANFENVKNEAKQLYEEYFDDNSYNIYMNQEILNKIRNKCSDYFSKNDCSYEMFDDALVSIYEYLQKKFIEFMKTDEYKSLISKLNINSYIQYKISIHPKTNLLNLTSY